MIIYHGHLYITLSCKTTEDDKRYLLKLYQNMRVFRSDLLRFQFSKFSDSQKIFKKLQDKRFFKLLCLNFVRVKNFQRMYHARVVRQ